MTVKRMVLRRSKHVRTDQTPAVNMPDVRSSRSEEHAEVLRLQQTVGNREVQRLVQRVGHGQRGFALFIQREYEQHNWENMKTYNAGSAAKEVVDAFNRAGYILDEIDKWVVSVMGKNGFGNDLWGHASGDNTQGKQGDTDTKIQKCKNFLIIWAGNNPKGSGKGPGAGKPSPAKQFQDHLAKEKKKEDTKKGKDALWEEYAALVYKTSSDDFAQYKKYKEANKKTKNVVPTAKGFEDWKKQ